MNILWIGYGKMGEPMASRVAAAGHDIRVHDASEVRRDAAVANGLMLAKELIPALAVAELIFCSLPHDAAICSVMADENSLLRHCKRGAILVETSTISVAASEDIAKVAQHYGVEYLRAPVSGSVGAAQSGSLTTFVSGVAGAVERARDVINAYASTMIVVGDGEQARVMKLAVNLMVTTIVTSLAEAYVLCRKGGIEPKVALDAIGSSAIGSPHLRFKADALERNDFTPTFTVGQMRKDLQLIMDGSRGLATPLFLGAAVEQIMAATEAAGLGDEDYLACVKLVGQLAGL